jgi:predicted ATPase
MQLAAIEIEGFKSIEKMRLDLCPLNVLIGANGAGKSAFIAAFGLLNRIVESRLQWAVGKKGGAGTFLHHGPKRTQSIRLLRRLLGESDAIAVTSVLDYYGLPSDFPASPRGPRMIRTRASRMSRRRGATRSQTRGSSHTWYCTSTRLGSTRRQNAASGSSAIPS